MITDTEEVQISTMVSKDRNKKEDYQAAPRIEINF